MSWPLAWQITLVSPSTTEYDITSRLDAESLSSMDEEIEEEITQFRHNDLSTNNVLVKRLRRRASAKYTLSGVGTWYVPDMPAFAALSDYDFVHVPGHAALTNERVVGGKYRVDGKPNVSYDTHFFLKSVYKCVYPRAARYPDAMKFLRAIGLQHEDRQDVEIPALDPARLLRNSYFDELRKPVPTDFSYQLNSSRAA
jgi:hypothetical protein